ncbi:MAG: methyltransferase [Planctomycetota bacterium]
MTEVLTVEQPCRIELECPADVHAPGPSSQELARYLFSVKGKSVLDLGCGTGIFALVAARLGARDVWATDVSSAAVETTRRNAARNGLEVHVKQGDLFEPVRGRRFDVIVTNPPQTPAPPEARGPKFGGEDGLRYFRTILREAPRHLDDGGQLLTFLISLADTSTFERLLGETFRFRPLPKSRREFTPLEYDSYWPGLFDFLQDRRRRGLAEFEEENGRFFYWVRYYMAMKK